jgi:hypothetical protein
MPHKYLQTSICALATIALIGCHTLPNIARTNHADSYMRLACAKSVTTLYSVKMHKVILLPSFAVGENGNKILNGQVDKEKEGIKEFRCIYNAAHALVDVMAMTPDGE